MPHVGTRPLHFVESGRCTKWLLWGFFPLDNSNCVIESLCWCVYGMGRETCTSKKSEEVISLAVSFRNGYSLYKFWSGKDFYTVLGRLIYVSQQSIYLVVFFWQFTTLKYVCKEHTFIFLMRHIYKYLYMYVCALIFMINIHIQTAENKGKFVVLKFLAWRPKQM